MSLQSTQHILMIRPASFGYNEETAGNNSYQQKPGTIDKASINKKALKEFDGLAEKLKAAGIHVILVNDTPRPVKPDAIFPNNWISFHEGGIAVLYSMYAANRRTERREDITDLLSEDYNFIFRKTIDLSRHEEEHKFLEGTGSLVFDRVNKIAYASVSERTDPELVEQICMWIGYKLCVFHATDNGIPVYHTNVILSVCTDFVILCADCITPGHEKEDLLQSIQNSGKEILLISSKQVSRFAGNALEIQTDKGEKVLVMSTTAFNSLEKDQVSFIQRWCKIIHTPLDTIEKYGGGSARCMMAEIFLQIAE